jgi:hypothetical protein
LATEKTLNNEVIIVCRFRETGDSDMTSNSDPCREEIEGSTLKRVGNIVSDNSTIHNADVLLVSMVGKMVVSFLKQLVNVYLTH